MDYGANANRSSDGSTSTSLLERVRANDAAAWRRLVQLYGPLIYHWCVRSSLSNEDAADLAQEVFRSVAARIGDFRLDREGDTFRGWLRTITVNKIRDLARRRAHEPAAVGGTEHQINLARLAERPPASEGDSSDQAILYRRALDLIQSDFEERTWKAFWLTTVEEQPTDDVAAALGTTPAAVRKAKSRVLRRLRETLRDEGDVL